MEVEIDLGVSSEGKAPNKGEQAGGAPSSQQCVTNGRGWPTGGTRGTGQVGPQPWSGLRLPMCMQNWFGASPGNWPT